MHDSSLLTLCFDCGGGGIKASVVDEKGRALGAPTRKATPYPLPPGLLVDTFQELANGLPEPDRITVGMPGMIRQGVVIATPHYITRDGPRSKVLPSLVSQWSGFDMRAGVQSTFNLPTIVFNDAEVAGAATIRGTGLEMIITLGTGLGNAVFLDGVLAPHVELSQGPVRWGLSYDDYVGEHERLRLGDAHWSRRVRRVVEGFWPMFMWDRLYIGGGNAKRITRFHREKMPEKVEYVSNDAGMVGGVKLWDLREGPLW